MVLAFSGCNHETYDRAVVAWTREDWRMAAGLWISALIVVCWFTHVLPGTNDGTRYSLAVAIGTQGSCEIGPIYDGLLGSAAIDKALVDGRYYCDKAPLGGFVAAPVVWLVTQFSDSLYVSYYCASLAASGIPGSLCPAFLFLIVVRLGGERQRAVLAAIGCFYCTNLLYWSTLMFSHGLSAGLLLAGITLMLGAKRHWQFVLAGLLAGLSVSSDYYMILILPILGCWCWYARGWRQAALMAFGGVVAGIFPAVYHALIFGSPFVLPYKYATHFSYLHSQGVYGAGTPRLSAAADILFGPRFGLFLFNPVLLLGLCGFWFLWKRDRSLFCMFVGSFLALLMLASGHLDVDYGFGSSWGPRYLVPVFFVFLIAATYLPSSPNVHRVATGLGGLSGFMNIAFIMMYYPPPRDEGLRHFLEGFVPVLQRYGGMSTLGQGLAVHTKYAPRIVLLVNLLVICGALYVAFRQFQRALSSPQAGEVE